MLLSVLSALARQDVDPWQEAAGLARLPVEAATERLTSLIAAQRDGASERRESRMIAARLIELLPRQTEDRLATGALPVSGPGFHATWLIALYVVLMICAAGAQSIVAGRDAPLPTGDATAPAASAVSPQTLPPHSGQ